MKNMWISHVYTLLCMGVDTARSTWDTGWLVDFHCRSGGIYHEKIISLCSLCGRLRGDWVEVTAAVGDGPLRRSSSATWVPGHSTIHRPLHRTIVLLLPCLRCSEHTPSLGIALLPTWLKFENLKLLINCLGLGTEGESRNRDWKQLAALATVAAFTKP